MNVQHMALSLMGFVPHLLPAQEIYNFSTKTMLYSFLAAKTYIIKIVENINYNEIISYVRERLQRERERERGRIGEPGKRQCMARTTRPIYGVERSIPCSVSSPSPPFSISFTYNSTNVSTSGLGPGSSAGSPIFFEREKINK